MLLSLQIGWLKLKLATGLSATFNETVNVSDLQPFELNTTCLMVLGPGVVNVKFGLHWFEVWPFPKSHQQFAMANPSAE